MASAASPASCSSAELASALGKAVTARSSADRPRVLIVRDTRESGEMLQAALAAGVSAAGGEALLGGVLPTPAAPLLIKRYGFDLAAVLSASHNPYQDDGIKSSPPTASSSVTSRSRPSKRNCGRAEDWGVAQHCTIVRAHAGGLRGHDAPRARAGAQSACARVAGTHEDYLRELESRFAELRLDGLDVLLNCANGATYKVAPEIFRRLGANVTVGRQAPTGATSTRAVARPMSPRSASRCAWVGMRSAWPSMATAIACSRSTAQVSWSTATS